jgi:lipoyl(octanoyl) transferase
VELVGGNALAAAWFGRIDYEVAWSWQRSLFDARLDGRCGDSVVLVEHPPTYTLGRSALESDVLYGQAEREARGIRTYHVDRGGRATYHGPGQLVGYPIVALGARYDVLGYLRRIEAALIALLADHGVEGTRDARHTGVWVGASKIAAIGVKITRGVTMHGFALNVATDLEMFGGIVPCGITDRGVTSLEVETGSSPPLEGIALQAATHLAVAFERELAWQQPHSLLASGGVDVAAATSEPAVAGALG